MNPSTAALFFGQPLFGEPSAFSGGPLVGGPASLDSFLGNAPGTTVGPPQAMYGFAGSFQGQSSSAVQSAIDALAAFEGLSGPVGYPVADIYPSNFRWAPRYCRFLAADFKVGTIVQQGLNSWSATFAVVFRET